MADLCDLLKDLMDLICGDVVTLTNGVSGPVSQAVWDDLDPATQSAIDKIDQIHGSSTPSYTPGDAGDENATVDTSGMTTGDMGDDLCERARAAYEKACVNDPTNHEDSSTKLYELKDVIQDLRAQAAPSPQ